MPFFNTGNAQWDQGFNTFGSSLGELLSGSKVGQATYYGAEARKAQIDAAKLQEQLAAGHQQLNMVFGQAPGQPSYHPTGPLGIPILSEPPPMGGGGGGPPPGPAPGPPAAALPSPTAAVPPPPAGPVGSNLPPGGLSAIFNQGGGEVPQPQPVPQTMPPAQAAQTIAAKMEDHPAVTGAPSPPAGPPAPGAPPAPNTTGSDGSTPPGPEGTMLHPGSLTPAGGGVKMSGPAAPDGSPAPAAFNIAQYVALAVMKGLPADQALQQGQAVVAEWVKNGQMDQRTADNILSGLGRPDMRVASIHEAGATTRTAMSEAGATQRTAMTEAGATQRTGMTIDADLKKQNIVTTEKEREFLDQEVQVRDPATGKSVFKKRRDLQPGDQAYDSTIAQIGAKPTEVQPGGPGTPPISMTTDEAQTTKTPVYQPSVEQTTAQQGGAYGDFINPSDPGNRQYTTNADARAKGLVPLPKTSQEWTAAMQAAIAGERDPAKRQDLIERYTAIAALPGATGPEDRFKQQQVDYAGDQRAYPMKQSDIVSFKIQSPIAFTPDAEAKIDERVDQLQQQNIRLRQNPTRARELAIQQLQKEPDGLPNAAEVEDLRRQGPRSRLYGVGDTRVSVYQAPGARAGSDHLMIGLKTPGQPAQQNPPAVVTQPPQQNPPTVVAQPPAPTRGAGAGKSTSAPRLSTVVVPQKPPAPLNLTPRSGGIPGTEARAGAQPPSGAIGMALPNQVENQIVHGPGGVPGVVHGGYVYPLAAAPAGAGG